MIFAGLKSVLAASLTAVCLSGCADLGYYWQSVSGHLTLLNAARPVNDWLGDTHTPAPLKTRLVLAQRIRRFAVTELKLPDNPSYHRYADLHRSAVVWNVVAAPEYSLTLKTWCFPVAGCVGYRGYFNESQARAEAQQLKGQGFETSVHGVPAYSTLGWMNWAGGDPLLSTFIGYPEGELARLVFHELARQAYAGFDGRRQQFRALTLATRLELNGIYEANTPLAQATRAQAALKTIAMQQFRDQYAQLKVQWGGYAGYDAWVARANNASFGAQAAYDDLVPGFEALFAHEGRDWQRFYDAVQRLASLPKNERHTILNSNTLEIPNG